MDGRVVALAVSTPARASALPNVPTTLEAGYANSDLAVFAVPMEPATCFATRRRTDSERASERTQRNSRRACAPRWSRNAFIS